ncbi:NAD-dependent epimerase/dehydratase family protein [Nocardioides sp. zg-579]|uniref:NAD-dependent epimerase/dehydratase family protein n=1 Tax=Nocardioides marmotae TaxID=2663857 RepID=A0A6I3JB71_9ACTN|nr:NAD-dependent epimerase/dehydratase family protein [Nocardioides marmotae]MCR6031729.1 NAD-dependent epimerase/dehydratase family protein [Gordonia jinghuaiqii]MTB95368.1 NAD-dependent epimerase/dehydratase family protein [Nocardioides marmotae]QKE02174.1 NAD-dependent epimerase/dehydratase family protein [Nocardioides marmotae]
MTDRPETDLTVAVTGPTGTFGAGLVPLLEADDRVRRVVGVARSAVDPAERGWVKTTYRRGDVRDPAALAEAFAGADVVVHLAFAIVGGAAEQTRAINVDGTLNAFHAAAEAGARRFVYASSVAAYGFHADNPVGIGEDWPTRPADRLFYAREKAELEGLLREAAAQHDGIDLYLLRPPIVVGPNAVGGKARLPEWAAGLGRLLQSVPKRLPPVPVLVPDLPLQLVHEGDVGRALLQCVVAAGPPGAYNIAADDTLTAADVVRILGGVPVPLPAAPAHAAARLAAALPGLPQPAQWIEALAHPALMDTTRAKTELGWSPRVSAADALRETLGLST